jgi:hypothetical protein
LSGIHLQFELSLAHFTTKKPGSLPR